MESCEEEYQWICGRGKGPLRVIWNIWRMLAAFLHRSSLWSKRGGGAYICADLVRFPVFTFTFDPVTHGVISCGTPPHLRRTSRSALLSPVSSGACGSPLTLRPPI